LVGSIKMFFHLAGTPGSPRYANSGEYYDRFKVKIKRRKWSPEYRLHLRLFVNLYFSNTATGDSPWNPSVRSF